MMNIAYKNRDLSDEEFKEEAHQFRDKEIKILEEKLKEFNISCKVVGINSIKDMNEYKEIMENVNQAKEELKRIDELIAVRSSRIDFLEDKTLRITGNQR
ncbi:Plasmid recombination enzyme [Streptococcus pneumoniae]|nr:Plasmid recombination enzyme [Streptococcus pneumoniae]VOS54363.1 Plasmid recombination enzyme [Streptococcus pneumoniae]VPD92737.1 Plasmid recombination enzyme [Streptococcus pneumoniae]VQH57849.1 Plasmid recombination enzyme [Streptococcus pneumoniae]VQI85963.1 Plasmid recombination enzyme [Streptococcus pneumoniae]